MKMYLTYPVAVVVCSLHGVFGRTHLKKKKKIETRMTASVLRQDPNA